MTHLFCLPRTPFKVNLILGQDVSVFIAVTSCHCFSTRMSGLRLTLLMLFVLRAGRCGIFFFFQVFACFKGEIGWVEWLLVLVVLFAIHIVGFVNFGEDWRCKLLLLSLSISAVLGKDRRRIVWDELLFCYSCPVRLRTFTTWFTSLTTQLWWAMHETGILRLVFIWALVERSGRAELTAVLMIKWQRPTW